MQGRMPKRANTLPAEHARWTLSVSRETDSALRSWLAGKGAKRGDLSRFVEDAVNRQVLREMITDIHARNADLDPDQTEQLVEDQLHDVRTRFWSKKSDRRLHVALSKQLNLLLR
jgi:hypothetical protein